MEWPEHSYDAAITQGRAVCVEHRGKHEYVWCGPILDRDGFCMGYLREQYAEKFATMQAAPPAAAPEGR